MPGVLKEMQDKLAEYQATYFNPDRGTHPTAVCDAALDTYNGF